MYIERLTVPLRELKFAGDGATEMRFEGYGAVFGNVDAYGDVIEPGAFSAYLAEAKAGRAPWPAMLSQHGGWGMTAEDLTPVGVYDDMAEDGIGLKMSGVLADTARARDLYKLMKMQPRPAIDGLSIGYVAKEWEPRSKPDDPRRRIKRIDLMEVSLVTFPANTRARVASVKGVDGINTLSDAERFLRDAGLPRSLATAFVSRVKRLGPSESESSVVAEALSALAAKLK